MARPLCTARGVPIRVGRELGRGGEGSVFEVVGLNDMVAKVYHQAPDAAKQAKLRFMAATADEQLLRYVAWPQETLHAANGGSVLGFLMAKVTGRDPVHMVYSPAHRRQTMPSVAWDFLLFVARNTAAAFGALHSHGHVLGDVNQGNVLVGADSKVVLIDSDSFQINAKGTLHRCEVGVSHFTPPELQSLSSFDGIDRSANHDNFGLALLVFHLLFGGRHPYSGVPLRREVGDALEADIKAFRYAYARDAQRRGFSPPPKSVPISLVPDDLEAMFHLAFTEGGAKGGRPTAKQWVDALDTVRKRLTRCGTAPVHVYPDHLKACPWCALEQQGIVYFLNVAATFTRTATGFVLARVWAIIEAIPPPPEVSAPSPGSFPVKPKPLPSDVPGNATIATYRIAVLALVVVVIVAFPSIWFIALLAGIFGFGAAGNVGRQERKVEHERRKSALDWAQSEFDGLVAKMKELGPEGFLAKRRELAQLRDEYKSLPDSERAELSRLHATAAERQRLKFLDTCFIDAAAIPGVGPGRKAALRSFGIETAADIEQFRVGQVRGFGARLTQAMLDWRASCESRFKFDPSRAVTEAEKTAVRARFEARRIAIEGLLNQGATDLKGFRQAAATKAAGLSHQMEWAAHKLAQARADMSLL